MEKEEGATIRGKVVTHRWHEHRHGPTGGVYGLAFVGAAVYFIQQADTFGMGVLGFFKAIVWPAILIYKILAALGA